MILQQERTLDQAAIGGIKTFRNGCNFRLVIDEDRKPWIEYGCYGVHINLCQGDEKLLYQWFLRQGEKRCLLPVSHETKYELLKRDPCPICGAPFVKEVK